VDYLQWLLQRYGANGVVLDTNILLLHIVGSLDPGLLGKIKRTNQFEITDYALLLNLLNLVPRVIVTPGILAESCNLLDAANGMHEFRIFAALKSILRVLTEEYARAALLSENVIFLKFGFTDSSIAELAAKGCVVLSDDLRLSAMLEGMGRAVINFNHLRSAAWIH
jgi:hypothetical protein